MLDLGLQLSEWQNNKFRRLDLFLIDRRRGYRRPCWQALLQALAGCFLFLRTEQSQSFPIAKLFSSISNHVRKGCNRFLQWANWVPQVGILISNLNQMVFVSPLEEIFRLNKDRNIDFFSLDNIQPVKVLENNCFDKFDDFRVRSFCPAERWGSQTLRAAPAWCVVGDILAVRVGTILEKSTWVHVWHEPKCQHKCASFPSCLIYLLSPHVFTGVDLWGLLAATTVVAIIQLIIICIVNAEYFP